MSNPIEWERAGVGAGFDSNRAGPTPDSTRFNQSILTFNRLECGFWLVRTKTCIHTGPFRIRLGHPCRRGFNFGLGCWDFKKLENWLFGDVYVTIMDGVFGTETSRLITTFVHSLTGRSHYTFCSIDFHSYVCECWRHASVAYTYDSVIPFFITDLQNDVSRDRFFYRGAERTWKRSVNALKKKKKKFPLEIYKVLFYMFGS